MNYHIKHILLITLLYNTCGYSQTNLICNPSFEEVDQDALNRLNDADNWYGSHVYPWGENNISYSSLFNCWMRDIDYAVSTPGSPVGGVSYGIVPGLFPTTDGSTPNYYGYPPNNPYSVEDDDGNWRIFVDDNGESGITLSTNSQGLHGLDLSPPNTKFGENVYAPDGNNYIALFDFENDAWDCVPSIFTELKYPLQKDVKYTFSMNFCKMNLLGYLKETEDWSQVKDGKIEVYISYDEAPLSPRQKICEIKADDNAWDVTTWDFIAERSYTHLLIEFDPIKGGPLLINTKIAGVFIDNVKLFEACETPENQCDNANYKRDLLDVKLETVNMESPLAFPDINGNDNDEGTFKTLRAFHLENVKRFEIQIFPIGSSTACYSLDMPYPPSDWFWDGNDYNGDPMPNGYYDAKINAVSNDCFHITNADEKNHFHLKRNYTPFNAYVGTLSDGNLSIGNLENVHTINIRILTMAGQEIYQFDIVNPRPVIAFSIESLSNFFDDPPLPVASYKVIARLSNNCATTNQDSDINGSGAIAYMVNPDAGGIYSQYYDYASVNKPDTFACPFDFNYRQNVLSPMNCCEGYLHLENMDVWNSWGTINIQDSILIGPNVVFEEGTYNHFNSGGQIIVTPAGTGVIITNETILKPNTFVCDICKNYTFESNDDYDGDYSDLAIETAPLQRDSLTETASGEMIIFPNPASGDQELTLRAGHESIDPNKYHLVLSNSTGSPIAIKVTSASEKMIRFKPSSALTAGVYYLSYESNGIQKTFSIIITSAVR